MKNKFAKMVGCRQLIHKSVLFGLLAAWFTLPSQAQSASGKKNPANLKPEIADVQLPISRNIELPALVSQPFVQQPAAKATKVPIRKVMAAIASTAAGGNWSATTTWVGGVVPTASDDVTIVAGSTVTLDVNGVAASVTVNATGSLLSSATTNFKLEVGGNVTNNGTLDLSNSSTIGSDLRFVGAGNATFSGTGTTDLHSISLAKAVRADVVDMNLPTLSVKGSTTSGDGFLLTRVGTTDDMTGTLKISGSATISNKVFGNAAAYFIPATGAFWLTNPNFTVTGQNGSPTVNGLLQITSGTFNVGTASGNSLIFGSASALTMDGGTLNSTGRIGSFTSATAAAVMTLTMNNGTINVATVGNASGTPTFGIAGTILFSGGTVNLVQRSTATTPLDYYVTAATGAPASSYTGGTVNFGTAATTTNFDFRIRGNVPNLTVDNTTNPKSVLLAAQTNVFQNVLITPGATLNLNGFTFLFFGPTFTNNGIFTGTVTGSQLYFFGSVAQTYTGTGTVTTPLRTLAIDNNGGGVTLASPMIVARVNMFTGNLIGASNLTIGDGTAIFFVVQFGATGLTNPSGNFTVAPNYNLGSGALQIIYSVESVARTTGLEIPANRTVDVITIANPNGVTVAGGDINVPGVSNASLFLTSGILTTTPTNKIIIGPSAGLFPTGSATSYVKGPLAITVNSATAVSRTFGVGDAAGWRPVVVGGITTTANQTFTATVVNGATGGSVSGPLSSLNPTRYVRLENTTNLPATATVQLSYGADDVIGDPATAVVAQAATANGAYASRGGALASTPTTGIVSTQNLVPGNDFFVIANTEGGTLATSVATVCSGTNSGTLTLTGLATGATITGYQVNTGSGFTAVSGTNTNPTYAFSNLATTSTFRAVIQTSDSRTVFSAPVTVTVNPAANAGFSYSGSTFCLSGTNPTPTISGTAGGTFSSTSGLTINATTGVINLASSTSGTYTVTYAVTGTCPASSTATVTITSAPVATFNYSAASFCQGTTTSPTPTFPTGSSAGTFSSTTGLSLNTTTGAINLVTSTPGTYTVTNNIAASGGCTAASATTTVIINPATTATFNYGTTSTFCKSAAAVTPTITGTTGGTFSAPAGLTLNTTTGAITPASSTAGTYTVTYNSGGACPSTGTQSVTIAATPAPTFTGLNAAYCQNAAAVTLASSLTGSTFTIDGTAATTLNPATLTVGAHTVVVSNTNTSGCTGTATQTVTINATPAVPTITRNLADLTSSAATGNQWYLNGTLIPGATGQTYTVTSNGLYTVTATANGCTSAPSAGLNIINLGIGNEVAGSSINLYPNPASGEFRIKLSGYNQATAVMLYNLTGQLISTTSLQNGEAEKTISLKGLAAGTYLVKVASEKGVQVSRLIVQ